MAKNKRQRREFGRVSKKGKRLYADYVGPDGARHSPGHSFANATDAEGWLSAERRLIDSETWTPPAARRAAAAAAAQAQQANAMTVGELTEDWLARATNLRETTIRSHRKRLELRAFNESYPGRLDSLRDVPVVDVDRARVRLWVEQMLGIWPQGSDGYSTCYYALKRLVTAFNWAKDELQLIDVNPTAGVTLPKPQTRNRDEPVFTAAQAQTLCDSFPAWLEHAPLILLWCGLRIGEALELRVKDVTGLRPGAPMTLKIRRDMQDVDRADGGKEVLINSLPKTEAGRRDVLAPEWVADVIRKHVEDAGKVDPEALIISRKNGGQFTQNNFRTHYFNPAKTAAGRGADSSVHSCRRFYGTQLVRLVMQGALSMEEARRLMGHETTAQLMEYQRAEVGYQQRAADSLNLLRPQPGAPGAGQETQEEKGQ